MRCMIRASSAVVGRAAVAEASARQPDGQEAKQEMCKEQRPLRELTNCGRVKTRWNRAPPLLGCDSGEADGERAVFPNRITPPTVVL